MALLSAMGWSSGCTANPDFRGPLPVRNQHPAQLTVLHMPPANTEVLPAGEVSGRLDAAYTSYFLSGSGSGNQFIMDGEALRLSPSAVVGLGANLQVEVAVPFGFAHGGFLDDFILDVHDYFGMRARKRKTSPNDRFMVHRPQRNSRL